MTIKNAKFSLYKDNNRGWVVTYFNNDIEATYNSYDDYIFAAKKADIKERIYGSRLNDSEINELIEEVDNIKDIESLIFFEQDTFEEAI